MSNKLFIRTKVPVRADRVRRYVIVFKDWIPQEQDAILVQEKGISLKLYLDDTCLHPQPEFLPKDPKLVHTIIADVTVAGLSDDLIEFMLSEGRIDIHTNPSIAKQFEQLARQVFFPTTKYLNRLVAYFRTTKGQFWLEEYPTDTTYHIYAFLKHARVKTENSDWVTWQLPQMGLGTGWPADESRYIDENDWSRAKKFVSSEARSPLVWELLAGAELLAAIGHRRSALTEAVTALEAAIFGFAGAPRAQEAFGPLVTERMNVTSLKKWIEHTGLSGTVHYLFPVIFSEDKMPTDFVERLSGSCAKPSECSAQRHPSTRCTERQISTIFVLYPANMRYLGDIPGCVVGRSAEASVPSEVPPTG